MTTALLEFIRRVTLNSEVPFDLRQEALNVLLENVRLENSSTIKIFYDNGTTGLVMIPFSIYTEIVEYIKASQMIMAIKSLRNNVNGSANTVLGLREAKISIENLRDQLGIVPPGVKRIF